MIPRIPGLRRAARALRRLRRDEGGAALIEFALVLPLFVTMGMYGTEIAYMSSTNMQVSQVALALADNASRLGQTDNSAVTPTVTEGDISSIMFGAMQQGAAFDLQANGRVILSSLERDAATGRQYIHWQRCEGDLVRNSKYGNQNALNGLSGPVIPGVGINGNLVTAPAGSAVMVAEVFYEYPGLFGSMFTDNTIFYQQAVMLVRDDRNLTPGVTGLNGTSDC